MYQLNDPLYGIPQDQVNEILALSGLNGFVARQYDCEKQDHIINIEGSIENEEARSFAEFNIKIYGTGHLICTRSNRTEFEVNEETLAQTEEVFIHEAEIKKDGDDKITEVVISNAEGEIREKYTLKNGEKIESSE